MWSRVGGVWWPADLLQPPGQGQQGASNPRLSSSVCILILMSPLERGAPGPLLGAFRLLAVPTWLAWARTSSSRSCDQNRCQQSSDAWRFSTLFLACLLKSEQEAVRG